MFVGLAVGQRETDGYQVGANTYEDWVGKDVGSTDGTLLGVEVGFKVGSLVGTNEGCAVGNVDGGIEGNCVGFGEG